LTIVSQNIVFKDKIHKAQS